MKLELIKMPNFRRADASGNPKARRRYIITINDVIVEDLKEELPPVYSREEFDQMVGERIKTFEIALNVKAKKVRGVE
jgi:hypothetical protein